MPTVTPPPPAASSPPVAPASAPSGVTPVEASVGNVPDKIQQLAQQIQVSGQITQPPAGGEITLNTVVGNLTILLPILAKEQQDKLLEQLTALFQNQRPLTVVIQPGNPPAQAFLLLPPAPPATNAPLPGVAQTNILLQTVAPPPSPLAPGVVLPAIVLPINTALGSNPIQQNLSPLLLPANVPPQPSSSVPGEFLDVSPNTLLLEELVAKVEAYANKIVPQLPADIPAGTPPIGAVPLPIPSSVPGQNSVSVLPLQPPLSGLPVSPGPAPPLVLTEPVLPQINPFVFQAPPMSTQAGAAPPLSSLLQPGMEVNLRVDAVALPSALPPIPMLPNQITATVTGSGPNGQLLVQSGNVTLYVKQSTDVPVGSTLLLTVEPAKPQALTPLPLPDAANFGALQQALTALTQADPQLARQIMENVVPQPNAALGGALLFFLSAFRQGDVRSWLGNSAVDILSRTGKLELVARLTQQLSEGGQIVHDPVVGAWRSYNIPLHTNNQFQTLHLYVHGDGRGGGGGKGETSSNPGANTVRFLIDMRLSKLGALQLDGFVRPKQLDMIIRSEQTLPAGLNSDLRQTYIKALEAVGYAGSLNFQLGRQHWLALRRPTAAGSVVT